MPKKTLWIFLKRCTLYNVVLESIVSPSPLSSAIRKLHRGEAGNRRCARFFKNRCIEVSDHPPRFHAEAVGHELDLVRSLFPHPYVSKDLIEDEESPTPTLRYYWLCSH